MSSDAVDIHTTAAAFLGGAIRDHLALSAFGVHPEMLPEAFRATGYAHEAGIAAGLPPIWPADRPASLYEVTPAAAEALQALGITIAEYWTRAHVLRCVVDLQSGLEVVLHALNDPATYTPGQALAAHAMACINDAHASVRYALAPHSVMAAKPPEEMAHLLFATAGEVRTLAGALEMMADGLFEEHREAGTLRNRAAQLRNSVDPPPVPATTGFPSSGALH